MAAFACGCEPDTDEEKERGEYSYHPVPPHLEETGTIEALLAHDFKDARGAAAGRVKLIRAEWLCDAKRASLPACESVPEDACHDSMCVDGRRSGRRG